MVIFRQIVEHLQISIHLSSEMSMLPMFQRSQLLNKKCNCRCPTNELAKPINHFFIIEDCISISKYNYSIFEMNKTFNRVFCLLNLCHFSMWHLLLVAVGTRRPIVALLQAKQRDESANQLPLFGGCLIRQTTKHNVKGRGSNGNE